MILLIGCLYFLAHKQANYSRFFLKQTTLCDPDPLPVPFLVSPSLNYAPVIATSRPGRVGLLMLMELRV